MFSGGRPLYDMKDLFLLLITIAQAKSPRSVPDQESNPEPTMKAC